METTGEQREALSAGDILVRSWGYDQTNIDFYVVTRRTPKTVTVREIGKTSQYNNETMTSVVMPSPGHFDGEPQRKKIQYYNGQVCLNAGQYSGSGSLRKWNGKPQTATHYA